MQTAKKFLTSFMQGNINNSYFHCLISNCITLHYLSLLITAKIKQVFYYSTAIRYSIYFSFYEKYLALCVWCNIEHSSYTTIIILYDFFKGRPGFIYIYIFKGPTLLWFNLQMQETNSIKFQSIQSSFRTSFNHHTRFLWKTNCSIMFS